MRNLSKFALLPMALVAFVVGSVHGAITPKDEEPALFFEVTGPGIEKPSYIFGTIHIVCTEEMLPIKTLSKYMSSTKRLFLELDFDDPIELAELMAVTSRPSKDDLTKYLTAEQVAKLDGLTKKVLKKPFEELKFSNPVLLQSQLVASPTALGCPAPGSYDLSLLRIALANKFPVEGLETVARQMEALSETPTKKSAESLYKVAEDPEKAFANMRNLMKVYRTQDADALYRTITKSETSDSKFQTSLLDKRNVEWIPIIEKAIKEKPSFFAFGAAHLSGEQGVLNLLRKRGFKIKGIRL